MRARFTYGGAVAVLSAVLVAGCGGSAPPDPPEPDDSPSASASTEDDFSLPPDPPTVPPTSELPPPPEPSPPAPSEPAPPDPPAPAPGRVPEELVGEWDGDGEGSARATKIIFLAEGYVELHYNNGRVLRGPAEVEGSTMTLHIPGGPMPVNNWSIEPFDAGYGYTFENLMLDGVSYVRQISGG